MKKFLSSFSLGVALMFSAHGVMSAQTKEVTLRVANYGGQFTAAQNKYAAELFTNRTGVKIQWIDGNPKDHLAKMIASKGREAPFDVVYLDDLVQFEAADAGVLMKLDPNVVTNLKYVYDAAKNKEGYGPGMIFTSVGLAYNYKKFEEAGVPEPKSWNDLWHPELKGHVAVPDITTAAGQDFAIAVALANGGNERNMDPAFKKLAKLQPLYFYTSSSDLRTKFLSGDAWAAAWYNGRAWGMVDEGFPMRFTHPNPAGFGHTTTIDVVAGTKYPKEAMQFVNMVLDPLSQLGQANEIPYGPVNKLLAPILKAYPELSKKFPSSPEDVAALYQPDWRHVNKEFPNWLSRWNREIRK